MNEIEEIVKADNRQLTSYLSFKLGDEMFAIDVKKVIEILEVPSITRIPMAPKYMAGIVNLRGKVLPLVDTRVKFGMEPIQYTVNTCVVVIEIEVEDDVLQVGTLVDAVMEVLDIPKNSIQPSPSIEAKYRLDFIQGMIRQNDDFILVLNLDQVFSLHDVHHLQETTEQQETN